ncbi:MAG TPA: transposase [Methanothrix sp.]|nr:transposase [Methanothrix sp.]
METRIKSELTVPEGSGYLFGDGEYDSRKFLNDVVDKGYMPVIKPRKISAGGFGSRIRDRIFNSEIYKHRSVCEGFFGALTNWFGDRIPCFLEETTITRILLRVMAYALRILSRFSIKQI